MAHPQHVLCPQCHAVLATVIRGRLQGQGIRFEALPWGGVVLRCPDPLCGGAALWQQQTRQAC